MTSQPIGAPQSWIRWPVASLRSYFLTLIALATVPLALLAAWLISEQVQASRAHLEADLARAASSAALTVEREIASSTDALYILSFSDPLQNGDIAGIFSALSALPSPRNTWSSVFLLDMDGNVLFNTRQPGSQPLGRLRDMRTLHKLQQTRQAVVTDLITGPDGHYATSVLVPVVVKGKLTYALGAWIKPASWRHLISTSTGTSSTAYIAIFDSTFKVVARNLGGEAVVASPLADETLQQVQAQPNGTGSISTLEGEWAYGAWHALEGGGWGVLIAEPAVPIDQAHRASVATAIGMGVLSVIAGIILSMRVARRLTDPLRRLAQDGPGQLGGEAVQVYELQLLEHALTEAEKQRETAREKLQAKATEFETLFRSSAVGLAITQTPDCTSVLRNPALARMLGELPSDSTATLMPRSIWPELDIRRGGQRLQPSDLPLQTAARTGLPQRDVDLEVMQPDGSTSLKLIAQAVPLFDPYGYTRGAIATFTDITEIKQTETALMQAERRLSESQYLIELAQAAGHVGFFNHDFGKGDVTWTSGLSRLFGLGLSDFEGPWEAWLKRVHADDRGTVLRMIRQITQDQQEQGTFEFRTLREDGQERWLSSRVQVTYSPSGEAAQMNGVVVDITQQKLVDQERAAWVQRETQARLEAEHANRAKDEFLAMLGHELRNPLGAISAGCEVLNRSEANPEVAQRARQIITRQTRHLGRLMDDLLDVARVISGQIYLAKEPLRLDQLVQRVVNTFEIAGHLRAHDVQTELEPVWVHADMTRMEQVITNLLNNAIKYTPEQGHITLGLHPVDEEAVLTVRDTGMGMTAELQAKAFDLFVQGERSLDRRQGGLGIGLTLVKRLAELHGGRVSVVSEGPNLGCEFTLRLPMTEPEKALHLKASRAPMEHCKVVVVEDNEDARDALTSMLSLDQHVTLSAINGREGLALIEAEQPDLALIDIGLPEVNGYEVAHRLRQKGYQGWLIALSGYGQTDDIERSRQAGFDDHLVKPINPDKLHRILTQASNARTSPDELDQGQ
ncbi:MAG: ATP-binding protein [Acidobacteriota bacterium]